MLYVPVIVITARVVYYVTRKSLNAMNDVMELAVVALLTTLPTAIAVF